MNPLFDHDDNEPQTPANEPGYIVRRGKKAHVEPPKHHEHEAEKPTLAKEKAKTEQAGADQAADLIRHKINELYADEPDAKAEEAEVKQAAPRSKHQQFMYDLSTSGKSLAHIQTAWHEYYVNLPDDEKHEVWQEFYAANARQPSAYSKFVREHAKETPAAKALESNEPHHAPPKLILPSGISPSAPQNEQAIVSEEITHAPFASAKSPKTVAQLRKQVLKKVQLSNETQRKAKQHVQSLLFGIGMGALALVIVLFSFFNEVIIAPFIQPSRHVTNTPIILSSSDITASSTPEVIIPKINVEIPVNYSLTTDDENTVENALEGGVVHYASTVFPGQNGNAAFFGHSSNNIFNPGQYKFAFVLLHTLVQGDIFYLTYNGTVYTYKVFDKQIVSPNDVSVLNNVAGHAATATLITCDPPGTSNNRLVVWGDQISPSPTTNTTATPTATTQAKSLASNGPSLWDRFVSLF